jgi:hypothetical protein
VAGKNYIIERSSDVFTPIWNQISTAVGTGSDMEYHDTVGGAVRFDRVRVAP